LKHLVLYTYYTYYTVKTSFDKYENVYKRKHSKKSIVYPVSGSLTVIRICLRKILSRLRTVLPTFKTTEIEQATSLTAVSRFCLNEYLRILKTLALKTPTFLAQNSSLCCSRKFWDMDDIKRRHTNTNKHDKLRHKLVFFPPYTRTSSRKPYWIAAV